MSAVDAQYYEVMKPASLTERLVIAARREIFSDFMSMCRPSPEDAILDVGVSDVVNDGANLIERHYPHPDRITAVGLGGGLAFQAAFPRVSYRAILPNAPLPFEDGQFDIAASNAVIEHVGAPEAQQAFVAELRRVARQVFITAPNRFFPVEHHTSVPLAHFHPKTFALACKRLGKAHWLDPANLILMDVRSLAALAPEARVGTTGLRLGPFSSNLYLHLAGTCGR
jgi:hypothetical protein